MAFPNPRQIALYLYMHVNIMQISTDFLCLDELKEQITNLYELISESSSQINKKLNIGHDDTDLVHSSWTHACSFLYFI